MRTEQRIARLEVENVRLQEQINQLLGYVAENAALREQVSQLQEQVAALSGRLAKDSHTSLKPPSSDGPSRRLRSQRPRSEKQMGGQPGHAGHTLMQVARLDEVVRHRPVICDHCQQPLEGVAGCLKERRQVHDQGFTPLCTVDHLN
jgi:transposase